VVQTTINYLTQLSQRIPVELFAFIASFVEEVFAPIPSPLVTSAVGAIAQSQGYLVGALFILGLLAAIGKTIGAIIIYFISDKAEDFVMKKIGPWLGFTHDDVERVGAHITGTWKSYVLLVFVRTVIPSFFFSASAGIIKMRMKIFVIVTLIGTFFRSTIFIFLGYFSVDAIHKISGHIKNTEVFIEITIAVALFALAIYLYWKRANGVKK